MTVGCVLPVAGVFYVLICYFSEKMSAFNLLRIAGGLFALSTTKDMGMVIAGLITMIMLAAIYLYIGNGTGRNATQN